MLFFADHCMHPNCVTWHLCYWQEILFVYAVFCWHLCYWQDDVKVLICPSRMHRTKTSAGMKFRGQLPLPNLGLPCLLNWFIYISILSRWNGICCCKFLDNLFLAEHCKNYLCTSTVFKVRVVSWYSFAAVWCVGVSMVHRFLVCVDWLNGRHTCLVTWKMSGCFWRWPVSVVLSSAVASHRCRKQWSSTASKFISILWRWPLEMEPTISVWSKASQNSLLLTCFLIPYKVNKRA